MHVSHVVEVYLLLFVDSFVASVVLPISRLTVFNVMCCFGGYEANISIAISSLGAAFGGVVNWFFGKLIYLARVGYHQNLIPQKTHNYICLSLLLTACAFSWVHIVGALINVVCGFFRVGAVWAFCSTFISYAGYLVYHLITHDCIFT